MAVQPLGGGDALLSGEDKRLCRALLLSAAIHLSALAAWQALDGGSVPPPARASALALELQLASPTARSGVVGEGRRPRVDDGAARPDRPAQASERLRPSGHVAPDARSKTPTLREAIGSEAPEWQPVEKAVPGTGGAAVSGGGIGAGKIDGSGKSQAQPAGDSEALYAPSYLRNSKPVYPERSRQLGEEGVATLSVRVGADGRALEVSVARGSGYRRLDQAAVDAVSRWRFVPAKRNGKPVESDLTVPVRFEGEGR
ncbi:energy transducer TonB [Chromobacterium vaccinii]|uniref:energy transducer TonB n=1 Tax=Chromobacterium vaccinii TaxID=1108595 RepID=UPI001E5D09F7|nr:energy transducer TonB [Chromobacterium vaccinii]